MIKRARRYAVAAMAEMQPSPGFFELCGSPIRTDVQLTYCEEDGYHAPVTPTTPPLSGSLDRPRTQVTASQLQQQFDQESKDLEEKGATCENTAETLSLAKAKEAGIVMSNWTDSRLPRMEALGGQPAMPVNISRDEIMLHSVLGQGAFGKVYSAKWNGSWVAVKVLIRQNLSEDILREFETEVGIMSYLNHPNICRLLGACLEPRRRALVIELVERGCLWNVLREGPLPKSRRIKMAIDVARGMEYLHSFDPPILHRDMKSPNLLVAADYSIKISDFGLARVKAQIQTMTGNCGTVQWMAPEVLSNSKYTEKADVYSFGIVMWEIFTGDCPYGNTPQIAAAMNVLNDDLRPVIPIHVPKFFARLMKTCWARDPAKRPSFTRVIRLYRKYYPEMANE